MAQDVPALVHLPSLMFSSMGSDVGSHDAPWRVAATGWFRDQLTRPRQFAGFVIEHPVDGVVSAALGSCDARAPGPHDVSGTQGHVFNISTEPAHRRCGYGRACLTELLTSFNTDTDVRVVDLNDTPKVPACTSRPASVNRRPLDAAAVVASRAQLTFQRNDRLPTIARSACLTL